MSNGTIDYSLIQNEQCLAKEIYNISDGAKYKHNGKRRKPPDAFPILYQIELLFLESHILLHLGTITYSKRHGARINSKETTFLIISVFSSIRISISLQGNNDIPTYNVTWKHVTGKCFSIYSTKNEGAWEGG